jgi:DNA-binding XRE family transcriptional regulator
MAETRCLGCRCLMLAMAFFAAMNTETDMKARMLLAKNLRSLRKARGQSQEEFADTAGFHRTYVSQIERGLVNVTIDNVQRLAEVFNVEIHELLQ